MFICVIPYIQKNDKELSIKYTELCNEKNMTFHGYGITNYFCIDSNKEIKNFKGE